jgi:HK97 family phage major capsid protein
LKNNGSGKVMIEKSMTIAANASTYTQGYVDSTVTRIAERKPFIQNLLSGRTLSGTGNVIYFEQQSRVGDAGVTAEGALKSATEYDLVEVRLSAKKVTATTKASMELIDDIPYMESLINEDLMKRVALKVDEQILSGSGLGANMKGIFTSATPFAAGTFALGVTSANRYDVLAIAVTQVYTNNFTPNYILLNPTDVAQMDVTKTSTGEYVLPAFVSRDGKEVKAVPIILNNGIPAGQYLVMDSTAAEIYTRSGLQVSIGYENDDFTKNMVTVIAEWRGLCVVKSNNEGAFVKGTFATDIAAILKP